MGHSRGHQKPSGSKRPPLTHFLCLPLVTESSRPQLEQSLREFRRLVTAEGQYLTGKDRDTPGDQLLLPSAALRPVGALHCTLGVMSLEGDQLSDAIHFLESLDVQSLLANATAGFEDAHAISTQTCSDNPELASVLPLPLHVSLKGMESMHAPKNTSVLYSAPADSTGRLYPFCVAIQDLFKQRGYLVNEDRKLKLHVTIVNTTYAKDRRRARKKEPSRMPSSKTIVAIEDDQTPANTANAEGTSDERHEGHGPNAKSPSKIDARLILEEFKDYAWAVDIKLDRLAICEMGARQIFDTEGNVVDGRYTEIATIPLPS